jgi:hypothetical protein
MALKARMVERDVCQLGFALYDPCNKQALPGPANGYLCSDVVSVNITENFSGGDKEQKEGGCGQKCITTTKPRCFEDLTGEIETCLWNPSLSELLDGAPLYVDANGKTVGGAGVEECPVERRMWIQYTVKLVPADYDSCTPGEVLDQYRTYIIPNALVSMTGVSLNSKAGLAENKKIMLRDGKLSRPADGYTGPFGGIPADFFSSFDAEKRPYYFFDHVALNTNVDCDELVAVV